MIKKYAYRDITWIDVENPTSEDIQALMKEYGIYPNVAQELLLPTFKPRVDLYKDFIYLILHFPAVKHTHGADTSQEIDFVIGKKFIITTRYDTIDSLYKFSKIFEVNAVLEKSALGDHAGYVLYHMVKELYQSLTDELAFIRDELKSIEDNIFKGREREMVVSLSAVSRNLLMFNHATSVHREVLQSLSAAARKFFGDEFLFSLHEIENEYAKVEHAVGLNMESMRELRETNNSLLETKQNEIMKNLTIMSFIMLPLSFIAALYSMNTPNIPFTDEANSFWIVIGGMAVIGLAIWLLFKRKRWF